MDLEDLKIVKRFLKQYEDDLPITEETHSELLTFVRNLIKEQDEEESIVHMDDHTLQIWISKTVDEYFRIRKKTINPFNNGNPEPISDKAIENRKEVIFKAIKGKMNSGEKLNGKMVFIHYLGGACEISNEYWEFKYDILQAYYTEIEAEFSGRC